MPLAVAIGTGTPGTTELAWVHASHMGVPIRYSDASGAEIATPTGYSIPGFPGQSRTFADLYYNRYRDYDSSTGRYIQADPIGLAGGPEPYGYALNNPLRYSDPSGLITKWEYLTGMPDSYRVNIMNGIAGVSDTLTLGATDVVREMLGINDEISDCNPFYTGGAILGSFTPLGVGRASAKAVAGEIAQVTANRLRGNAARDELADLLRQAGRDVNIDEYFWTPFGKRYVDIDVWHNGVRLGGIEVKTGGSHYLPHQRAKDMWLRVWRRYPVQLVRLP
jgi:RHS repeat-associated protein